VAGVKVQDKVKVSRVNKLCETMQQTLRTALSLQPSTRIIVKLSVTFPNFRGDESEDVHKFVNNY